MGGRQQALDDRVLLALLRGINVGGNKVVPMAALREVAVGLGLRDVGTYIQSGNLVFTTDRPIAIVETSLEEAIEHSFGFSVEVIVRTAEQWQRYAGGSPFPDAERERPNKLYLGLSKRRPASGAEATLRARAQAGERVEVIGDAIWLDYPSGAGRSKLTPAVLDRAAGSTVTMRNWRTVTALAELLRAKSRS